FEGTPPALVELRDVRGDLHVHTTWSDGKSSVLEMAEAARALGYRYLAICDHTRSVRVVPGLDADDVRRQGEEIAAANEVVAPFRVLRGIECDILADGSLDLLDAVLAACVANGTAVETNGLPDRIDLRAELVREAIAAGVLITCSTDAHSVAGLGHMRNSVATARRGWATAADVLNTRPLDEVLAAKPR